MWSELGVVGVLLFGAFLVAAVIAALRTRRLGRSAAALVAGSLAAGANWLFHASYDWFWHYPALTAPAIFLLGAAAGPSIVGAARGLAPRLRYGAVAVLAVAALIALPLFMSDRYANHAYDESADDPQGALDNLDRAADLNPYDPRPLFAKGVIQSQVGEEDAALSSFRAAIDRQPDNFAGHYFLAEALVESDPATARAEIEEAERLNPIDPRVRRLMRRLERESAP